VCGDGVVEGDEECDDGNLIDLEDACSSACTRNLWIFATAAIDHQGDLGGVEGAHSRCRQYALQSGRADDTWMNFVAWISDADHDARDLLHPGRGRYLRTDHVVVADSFEQLLSGTLNAPIDLDEHGDPAPGGALTGTKFDGTAAPGTHCESWTTKTGLDVSLYYGSTAATDSWWTLQDLPDANPAPCSIKRRLYCIEGA
jgi:cysteine-rich repeat protein